MFALSAARPRQAPHAAREHEPPVAYARHKRSVMAQHMLSKSNLEQRQPAGSLLHALRIIIINIIMGPVVIVVFVAGLERVPQWNAGERKRRRPAGGSGPTGGGQMQMQMCPRPMPAASTAARRSRGPCASWLIAPAGACERPAARARLGLILTGATGWSAGSDVAPARAGSSPGRSRKHQRSRLSSNSLSASMIATRPASMLGDKASPAIEEAPEKGCA